MVDIICNFTLEGGDNIISKDVAILLLCGADPNACADNGVPVLHVAAFRGLVLTAYALIGRGADVNAQDPDGNTALMAAVIKRDENMVRLLLEAGADKTIMNNEYRSPKSIACGSIHKLLNKWNPETTERMFIHVDELETREQDAPYEFGDDDTSSDELLSKDEREAPERTSLLNDTPERKDELKLSSSRFSENKIETSLRKPTPYRGVDTHIDRNPVLPRTYVENKSRNWYILWALLFPGVHNLYAGYKTRGIIQIICMLTIAGIYVAWPWAFVEAIVIQRDGKGNAMKEGSFLKVFLLWLLSICVLGMALATLSNKDTNDVTESSTSIRAE